MRKTNLKSLSNSYIIEQLSETRITIEINIENFISMDEPNLEYSIIYKNVTKYK